MNYERVPININTYLEQAKTYATQKQWELVIFACQQTIALCQGKITATQSQQSKKSQQASVLNSEPLAKGLRRGCEEEGLVRELNNLGRVPSTPESSLNQGDLLLSQGNWEAAMIQYRQVLTLNPNIPQAYQRIAEVLSKQGNWQQATAYYRQAVQLDRTAEVNSPSLNYQAYLQQGNLLRSQGKIETAIESYQQAVKLKPDSADLFANLGSLYAEKQQWQNAIASYQKALELEPNLAVVYRNLARVFEQINQLQLAAQYWEKAVNLAPNRVKPPEYLRLGQTFQQQQNLEKAIALYCRAIELQPDLTEAYLHLEKCLQDFAQPERALDIYRQLIRKHPDRPEPLFYLGQIFSSQKKWTEANSAYRQAIKLQPNLWQAYLYLAGVMLQQSQWQDAAEICRQALKIKSDVSWLYHHLGYAEFKLKHWQASSIALRQAIELNSDFPWSHFYLGEILIAQGEQEKAVRAYLAAIELDQDLPGVYKQLGIVLRQQYQVNSEEVVTYYQQNPLLSTKNCNSNFYSQLATNLVQHKQLDGAVIFSRLAAALEPNHPQINQQLQQVQKQQEQRETEINNLRSSIRENPQTPHLYNQLGNLLADLGEYQEASRLHRQTMVLRGWHLALETRNYQFHYDWFTHNISVWEKYLHSFKQADSIKVLEIGSYEGMATCWLLDCILTKTNDNITCIDLYFQPNFEHNIAQTGAIDKVTQLVGNSQQILPTLKPYSYDLIYIDGSHLAEDARKDALLAWDLLKENGLIIFDDYEFKIPETPDQEPKIGIDNFLLTVSAQFKTIHQEYQLIIQKIKSIATER